MPLGDRALLVRFGERLDDASNAAAIGFAGRVEAAAIPGVVEVVLNLVSVLLRFDPEVMDFERLAGEVRLLGPGEAEVSRGAEHRVAVTFDGADLEEVAALVGMSVEAFVTTHNARVLRVLATGFAPGFLYCGLHDAPLVVPRRAVVRRQVPAGTLLFAAGQTAITSTPIPTGWHVIGRTEFRNFDAAVTPPTQVRAGDRVRFEVAR